MPADHREYPRYALEAAVTIDAGGARCEGRTSNLSSGGLAAIVPTAVPAGSAVIVRLALIFDEDTFSEPLALPARVVWATQIGDSHQIGVQFAPLSDEDRSYLEMFLRYLEEARRQQSPAEVEGDPFDS